LTTPAGGSSVATAMAGEVQTEAAKGRDQSAPAAGKAFHPTARVVREAEVYDEGRVLEASNRWMRRVMHVLTGPNTALGEDRFRRLLRERADTSRVLDVGCGPGTLSGELHAMGATSVHGIDVSQREVEKARSEFDDLMAVTFGVQSADEPIEGQFDLIVGRAILHHLDFRRILPALFERNLAPGGRMVFMEPMSHPLTLAFHHLVRSAHTPDEWPLTPDDVRWLKQRFDAYVIPINLLSFPAGIFSSLFLSSPDNPLMRFADRIDRALERRRHLAARGRQGLIVIDRPAVGHDGATATELRAPARR
jgi:SAM-dependent methyltransferase